jgi:hypothetical protein
MKPLLEVKVKVFLQELRGKDQFERDPNPALRERGRSCVDEWGARRAI